MTPTDMRDVTATLNESPRVRDICEEKDCRF